MATHFREDEGDRTCGLYMFYLHFEIDVTFVHGGVGGSEYIFTVVSFIP